VEEVFAVMAGEFAARTAAGALAANYAGIARVAMAFAAGGAVYTLTYRFFYPVVWFVRNAVLLALGLMLIFVGPVRAAVADLLSQAPGGAALDEAIEGSAAILAALGITSLVLVGYAMHIQRFRRSFDELLKRVTRARRTGSNVVRMLGCSLATTGATLTGMIAVRPFKEPRCRLVPAEADDEDDDEDEDEEDEKPAKARKRSRRR
jgi:hypothetical protein